MSSLKCTGYAMRFISLGTSSEFGLKVISIAMGLSRYKPIVNRGPSVSHVNHCEISIKNMQVTSHMLDHPMELEISRLSSTENIMYSDTWVFSVL